MRILFSADHHVKLGQKGVPQEWQKNRFIMLATRLDAVYREHNCDLHIIGGDILDVATPSTEELELMYAFLDALKDQSGLIYTGNHEMKSKTISCLFHLADNIFNATAGNWKVITEPYRSPEFDIVDYVELHKKKWKEPESKLCFTHVRGEIPPHVKPEVDLTKFNCYHTVVAGDLHSYKNTQQIGDTKLVYPGSPLTTSFHRERTKGTNGCLIIDTDTLEIEWVELGELPQLIRKTITVDDMMEPDPYDRVIYEVEGDVTELKNIKHSDLLDKKLNTKVTKDAKLDLADLSLLEELDLYLRDVQKLPSSVIDKLKARAAKYV